MVRLALDSAVWRRGRFCRAGSAFRGARVGGSPPPGEVARGRQQVQNTYCHVRLFCKAVLACAV
eukprot:4435701-Alexandrium_andersonii.AAC.1